MLKVYHRNIFEKDVERVRKRGLDLNELKEVMKLLAEEKPLPIKYRDHSLSGNFVGHRECHIQPNWLLIYKKQFDTISFERTGTHSDLFKT